MTGDYRKDPEAVAVTVTPADLDAAKAGCARAGDRARGRRRAGRWGRLSRAR
jgi:hypothetical protein